MTHQPTLTPREQNLLQLAQQVEHGVLGNGRLYNKLLAEYDMNPTRFWQIINTLRANPAARAEFPLLMRRLDARATHSRAAKAQGRVA